MRGQGSTHERFIKGSAHRIHRGDQLQHGLAGRFNQYAVFSRVNRGCAASPGDQTHLAKIVAFVEIKNEWFAFLVHQFNAHATLHNRKESAGVVTFVENDRTFLGLVKC